MSTSRPHQVELDFSGKGRTGANNLLNRQRLEAIQRIQSTLGMPIGKHVEVWLKGGVHLQGLLKLKSDLPALLPNNTAPIEFLVKGIPFTIEDVEACSEIR